VFIEIKNFFSDDFCDEIIEQCSSCIDKNKVSIEYNREGNTVDFKEHEKLQELDKKIFDKLTLFLQRKILYSFNIAGMQVKDSGYSFHRYEKGDKLYTHCDEVFNHNPESIIFHPRILSIVVNLTNNENADLIFPRHNKAIKSEKGKLIAFLPHSCYEHYMNNKSDKNRDVLVTWLLDSNIECRVKNG
jgi:hypothetical protein|tara:strand:- start:37 stop:600 length:564 start_codon:yes stop_codon:yes gene_type:complete